MNTADKIMSLAVDYAEWQEAKGFGHPATAEACQALRKEIEALVADAQRYRWLRDEAWGGNNRSGPHLVVYRPGLMPSAVTELAEDAADAEIDTAIQRKQS